jgi:lactate dehydrogenase-like 2-hydroxyacid dehydrogenase
LSRYRVTNPNPTSLFAGRPVLNDAAHLTKERFDKAKKLKLIITAGIGSDHTDLQAAMDKGVTVAEVTYCNSISVSEHIVMMILALVRNYIPSYGWVVRGGWNIADCVERSYDLEGMNVGTIAAGRIGLAALRRLKPFDVKLHYTDKHRLPKASPEGKRRSPVLQPGEHAPFGRLRVCGLYSAKSE